jgi:hypothetical protein
LSPGIVTNTGRNVPVCAGMRLCAEDIIWAVARRRSIHSKATESHSIPNGSAATPVIFLPLQPCKYFIGSAM